MARTAARVNVPTLSSQLLRTRLGKVCVAITGTDAAELVEKATAALRDTGLLEFRLDYASKPLETIPRLKQFLEENSLLTAIATCRSEASGGHFKGSVTAELEILTEAGAAGFQLVDLSLESAEAAKPADLARLRASGAALLLSYHDFKATRDLDAAYDRMTRFAPDFFKIVPTARTLTDNLTLIRFLERMTDVASIVGICMGEAGVISRVLGIRAGSAFTFAAAEPGEETAPGQIDARTLLGVYRLQEVDAATHVFGLAGNPVAHSLSPLMMNTAFRRETLNSVYLALKSSTVTDLLRLVHELPIYGLSVTMPFKQEILPHLERMDPLSKKIGACNTVIRTSDGKLLGFNTDVAGILTPLEKRLSLRGARVLVLGAGGAARAAAFGLQSKGAEVFLCNRTAETAQKLARQAQGKAIRREVIAKSQFDVIINATSVGMTGQKPQSPLNPDELRTRLVFDLVYNPIETPLLRMARQQNIPVITGVEMFVQQGARQFEIWTGKQAPEEEMLRVVLHALRQRSEQTNVVTNGDQTDSSPAKVPSARGGHTAKAVPAPNSRAPQAATPAQERPLARARNSPQTASVAAKPAAPDTSSPAARRTASHPAKAGSTSKRKRVS